MGREAGDRAGPRRSRILASWRCSLVDNSTRLQWWGKSAETARARAGGVHEGRRLAQHPGPGGTFGRRRLQGHLELGDLAEPLGFDSIFALEHHFTGYSMSPAPMQLLSYFAGRTKRVTLGTAVIVLPWHDPIRVAERSRCWTFCAAGAACSASAVARPAWNTPASAFRWRRRAPRFVEVGAAHPPGAQPARVRMAGRVSTRSRAPRSARGRSPTPSGGSTSPRSRPESAEIMAKLGFGMMVIMQNEWPKAASRHRPLPRDRRRRRPRAAAADHPDQRVLRGKP